MLNSYYTNAIAKIAEKFVSRYFNDFYDNYTDVNQFGCVRGRSISSGTAISDATHDVSAWGTKKRARPHATVSDFDHSIHKAFYVC